MLQRIGIEKNVNRQPKFLVNFAVKRTDLNAFLAFFSHLAFQRDPKPFNRFIALRVSSRKKSKSYILDSGSILKSLLLEAKKRHLKHTSCPNFSTES